jgi:hypothetical protein
MLWTQVFAPPQSRSSVNCATVAAGDRKAGQRTYSITGPRRNAYVHQYHYHLLYTCPMRAAATRLPRAKGSTFLIRAIISRGDTSIQNEIFLHLSCCSHLISLRSVRAYSLAFFHPPYLPAGHRPEFERCMIHLGLAMEANTPSPQQKSFAMGCLGSFAAGTSTGATAYMYRDARPPAWPPLRRDWMHTTACFPAPYSPTLCRCLHTYRDNDRCEIRVAEYVYESPAGNCALRLHLT